jgi:hypothetical protein
VGCSAFQFGDWKTGNKPPQKYYAMAQSPGFFNPEYIAD